MTTPQSTQPKIIQCFDCTTEHPEDKPCPNCEAWARIATKAGKARREWHPNRNTFQARKPHND